MTLSGTNMPLIVFGIIIIEIVLLFNQWFIFMTRPNEEKRRYHLILLLLLILYNIIEGFFPDNRISFVPPLLQNFLGFGFGYFFASYCPFFFWRTLELDTLKVHGKYGFLFLLVPLLFFYGVLYPINLDLDFTRKYVYIIPVLYAVTLFTTAIRSIFKAYRSDGDTDRFKQRLLIYSSWLPVTITPLLGDWLGFDKWIITVFINLGFLIVDPIYINQAIALFRSEQDKLVQLLKQLEAMDFAVTAFPMDKFLKNCGEFDLTKREIEISALVAQGLDYKQISEMLNISERTVTTHIQNIYGKIKVSTKVALIKKLYD